MSLTDGDVTRTTKGILLTAVVVAIFSAVVYATYGQSVRELLPLVFIFAVFVAMMIGIGMFMIDVVTYFENQRTE